jgi:hypothetical protein
MIAAVSSQFIWSFGGIAATKSACGEAGAKTPNHSLNRTFCGIGQLGFISFSPNCPTPQNAG